MKEDWLLVGDFNEIACPSEKKRGGKTDNQACRRFADWINACSLIDLGFVGSKYTWKGPKWEGLDRVFKRLDRALSNAEWRTRFPDARVDILTRTHSDHHPMMISLEPSILRNGRRPFRYEAMWSLHPDFEEFINQNWRSKEQLSVALDSLTKDLRVWNREIFGHIGRQKELYSEEDQNPPLLNTEISYPPLKEEISRNMDSIPTVAEIRKAIFSIGSLKAPGIDGFPALFYKENWNVIQKNVVDHVLHIWNNPCNIKECNQTLISLIPKVQVPESITQFRPIALCNVSYKCITKILVERIKPALDGRISPYQSSFIPGRKIQDNIIIAKEILHSMKKIKGKKGFMAIKYDFEKAYDRLRWSFLQQCLMEFGIPNLLVQIIMECILSVAYNVIWNGEKTEEFRPSRKIRQGDPILPYLFVIAMDKLSHLIEESAETLTWKEFKVGKEGSIITHLLFADDLLIFAEANTSQIDNVGRVMEKFCQASGLKVNRAKTSIVFSNNIKEHLRRAIKDKCNYQEQPSLGKYLGAMITNKRSTKENFKNVIQKMQSKLKRWKINCLSLAGRVTLAKSVITPIANYDMQHTLLPKGICNEIEKLQRSFIWGELQNMKKMHQMSWSTRCLPKNQEGLDISKIWKKNRMHFSWWLNNGKSVSFFNDRWLEGEGPLVLKANREINDEEKRMTIAHFVNEKGEWNRMLLSNYVEGQTYQSILNTTPPRKKGENDQIYWSHTTNGDFTIASAYQLLTNSGGMRSCTWKIIWKWQGPERIKTFTWLLAHERLLTAERKARMFGSNPFCHSCQSKVETLSHVMRDYPRAAKIWAKLLQPGIAAVFFNLPFSNWITFNLENGLGKSSQYEWRDLFLITYWMLWKWRNMELFSQPFQTPKNGAKIGWVKLNTDGAVEKNQKIAACGGLIRTNEGKWVAGFIANLGNCNVIHAELKGVFHGLEMAWDLGMRRMIVEMDFKEGVEFITRRKEDEERCCYNPLIQEIRRIKNRPWELQFRHTCREANRVADSLAKLALSKVKGFQFFDNPPDNLEQILDDDVKGIYTSHIVPCG
ncbi:uncharacterized protein LOC107621000 [Arachis ipaensis]|uniref:uncharacterized protein LOC107621000 n=1 Tax=Arachis ipaensis TaxID=130454 RepID=UPI0007AF87E2|nr:uncharacterized protein LOC107621000 [Arachis ipaensis]